MKLTIVSIATLILASTVLAQQPPRPDGGGGRGGPGGGAADGFDNPPPFNGPGQRGPMAGGGPMGGNPMMMQVELMRSWLDLIDRYAKLSRDPVTSGVAAVVSADDLFKGRPPEQAIEYFTKLLGEVKNETVQRAIRLQLIELYGKNNDQQKALEQLRQLMIEVPSGPEKRQP